MQHIGELVSTKAKLPVGDAELMALLPAPVKAALEERWQDSYGTAGFDSRFVGYKFKHALEPKELEAAFFQVRSACAPASPEIIITELARMRSLTKSRATDSTDAKMMLAALAEEMRDYPADVIQDACRKWSRMETFWPSWAELKDMLDFRMRKRKALLKLLEEATAD